MIKKFLNYIEDPTKPLLGPNLWLMKAFGLILPTSQPLRSFYIMVHILGVYLIITIIMEVYILRSDLNDVLNNLKISMLSLTCISKGSTAALWQKDWLRVVNYVTETDSHDRKNQDKIRENIINKYTKYCRMVTYIYWFLTFITYVIVCQAPLVKYLASPVYRENLRNGTDQFMHIIGSWMPVDKNRPPGCWITMGWHFFICTYGAGATAAYDTSSIVIMVYIGGKLDLLRERSKLMFKEKEVSEEEAKEIVRELHDTHVVLTENFKVFNSVLSPIMFLYMVVWSFMLCANAYQFIATDDTTQRILLAEFILFGVGELFMFCWHSTYVLKKSEQVMFGPYESEWWKASVTKKKHVLTLAGQFRKSYIFTAGPFADLTLSSFINILKGSYSYYTLLKD